MTSVYKCIFCTKITITIFYDISAAGNDIAEPVCGGEDEARYRGDKRQGQGDAPRDDKRLGAGRHGFRVFADKHRTHGFVQQYAGDERYDAGNNENGRRVFACT